MEAGDAAADSPKLNELAANMFQKTGEYIQAELSCRSHSVVHSSHCTRVLLLVVVILFIVAQESHGAAERQVACTTKTCGGASRDDLLTPD